jgi:hypothetical protein
MARMLMVYCIFVGCIASLSVFTAANAVGAALDLVLGGGLIIYGVMLGRRLGVVATTDGMVLHGPLGSRRVAWREADRFTLDSSYPWRVSLRKRDGTWVKAWGLGASAIRHGKTMEESRQLVEALNNLVGRHGGFPRPQPPHLEINSQTRTALSLVSASSAEADLP